VGAALPAITFNQQIAIVTRPESLAEEIELARSLR
jgi:hypothetical protein